MSGELQWLGFAVAFMAGAAVTIPLARWYERYAQRKADSRRFIRSVDALVDLFCRESHGDNGGGPISSFGLSTAAKVPRRSFPGGEVMTGHRLAFIEKQKGVRKWAHCSVKSQISR